MRAVVGLASTKPITEAPDVGDLKNGSSKSYAEAIKELTLLQRLLKPQSESSKLQLTVPDREVQYVFLWSVNDSGLSLLTKIAAT